MSKYPVAPRSLADRIISDLEGLPRKQLTWNPMIARHVELELSRRGYGACLIGFEVPLVKSGHCTISVLNGTDTIVTFFGSIAFDSMYKLPAEYVSGGMLLSIAEIEAIINQETASKFQ